MLMNRRVRRLLSAVAVVFAVALAIFCFSNNGAVLADGTAVMMAARIESSITVEIDDLVEFTVVPHPEGRFGSERQTLSIYTNSPAGYTVSMSPGGTNLEPQDVGVDPIPTLGSGSFTVSSFTVNHWGISINGGLFSDGTSYHAIASGNTQLANSNSPTGAQSDEIDIDYGVKLNLDTVPNEYSTQITFAVVANIAPKTIRDMVYMQDFAKLTSDELTSVKQSMTVGDDYKLVDNRDDKMYFVAKQADGNIWMTQNLDLCIGCTGVSALTSENTDINDSITNGGYTTHGGVITWTPASTAITSSQTISGLSVSPGIPTSGDAPYSVEGGETYVYPMGVGLTGTDIAYPSLTQCKNFHSEGDCLHYHVGNYYNWYAAVAINSGANLIIDPGNSYIARNSICPAGWRLPNGRAGDTAQGREFGQLFLSSGATSTLTATSYASDGFEIVRAEPLFFVRGGYVSGSTMDNKASTGYYWSSTLDTRSTPTPHLMWFGASSLGSGTTNYNNDGNSGDMVRCLAR